MVLSSEITYAILAMDSYNRGYDVGLEVIGSSVGSINIMQTQLDGVTVNLDSAVIRDPNTGDRLDDNIGFYALAYEINGVTIISYRGTDDLDEPVNQRLDEDNGWGGGFGTVGTPQADMAFAFYKAVAEGLNVPNSTNVYLDAAISLTGHSMGGGLAGLVAANDNFQWMREAA